VFGGLGSRITWIAVGVALAGAGLVLIKPTLGGGSAPPRPWALAVGVIPRTGAPRIRAQTVVIFLRTAPGCTSPVHVSGRIEGTAQNLAEGLYVSGSVAASGARIRNVRLYDVDVSDPALLGDKALSQLALRVSRRREAGTLIRATRFKYPSSGFGFTFDADIAKADGFGTCVVATPQLLPHYSLPNQVFERDEENPFEILSQHTDTTSSAMAITYADGWLPDAGSLPTRAVVTSTIGFGRLPGPRQSVGKAGARSDSGPVVRDRCIPVSDAFADSNTSVKEASNTLCQETLHFARAGAQSEGSSRTFFSGLVMSLALALLLEGLFLGRQRDESGANPSAESGSETPPTDSA
jgi:hypothetical protein